MLPVAEKLKEIRKSFGCSQFEFAIKLEVSPSTISFWETGRVWPSALGLIKIETLLGTNSPLLKELKTLIKEVSAFTKNLRSNIK